MRIKENIFIRKIGDEYMMITESESGLDYTRVIQLNESAAHLTQEVQDRDFTEQEWTAMLVEKYNVSESDASQDVRQLIKTLSEAGVILP